MKVTGYNHWDKVLAELKKLNEYEVAVGFFGKSDSKLITIVRANEFGATIRPKKHDYLFVPYKKTDSSGKKVKGFYKLKIVKIPARPFMRTGLKKNKRVFQILINAELNKILHGDQTAFGLLNRLGLAAVKAMRESAIKWKNPKNAPLTIENKGSDNPLVDTGELERKITYKIVRQI